MMHAGTQQAQKDLGELETLRAQTDAMSKKILDAATHRLEVVQKALAEHGAAATKGYRDLIMERGQLEQVIAAGSI